MSKSAQEVRDSVKNYYGNELKSSADLKTSACTSSCAPPPSVRKVLKEIPKEVNEKFYGCGSPIPEGIEGMTILDLGCGTGRDVYAASKLVGEGGHVVGLDMTDEQLDVAERNKQEWTERQGFSKPNVSFVKGQMEDMRSILSDDYFDLVISNCVINLSPDKEAVLSEAYRVLKPGGEMYFSDVYSSRRLPQNLKDNEVLHGECLAGALYCADFKRMCRKIGFNFPMAYDGDSIAINDAHLQSILGNASFYSITYRLFKLPSLMEPTNEDYGHVLTYNGTIPGSPSFYKLDEKNSFETGRPMRVSGNVAAACGHSWLRQHFDLQGDFSAHFGAFGNVDSIPNVAKKSKPSLSSTPSCC